MVTRVGIEGGRGLGVLGVAMRGIVVVTGEIAAAAKGGGGDDYINIVHAAGEITPTRLPAQHPRNRALGPPGAPGWLRCVKRLLARTRMPCIQWGNEPTDNTVEMVKRWDSTSMPVS